MRLFVALNLPSRERDALHDALGALRASSLPVRWTSEAALHLTLNFLGEVNETTMLQGVLRAVAGVARRHGGLSVRLGGMGVFPSVSRARVWWVGAEGGDALLALHADVEKALSALGFAVERRPYHPHITVGRTKNGTFPVEEEVERRLRSINYETCVEIRTVEVMESRLSSAGAQYEVAGSFVLGTGSVA